MVRKANPGKKVRTGQTVVKMSEENGGPSLCDEYHIPPCLDPIWSGICDLELLLEDPTGLGP